MKSFLKYITESSVSYLVSKAEREGDLYVVGLLSDFEIIEKILSRSKTVGSMTFNVYNSDQDQYYFNLTPHRTKLGLIEYELSNIIVYYDRKSKVFHISDLVSKTSKTIRFKAGDNLVKLAKWVESTVEEIYANRETQVYAGEIY